MELRTGSCCCPYSPECVEEEFSEVRCSKLPGAGPVLMVGTGPMLTLSRSHRSSSHHSRRGFVASGCDSQHRNYPRIPVPSDRGRPNFALTEFYEVRFLGCPSIALTDQQRG